MLFYFPKGPNKHSWVRRLSALKFDLRVEYFVLDKRYIFQFHYM